MDRQLEDPLVKGTDVAQLRKKLEAAVRAILPAWMSNSLDDIVQCGLMAVLKQLGKGEANRKFPTSYIRRVAYTAMIDEIRRLRSRKEVSIDAEEEEMPVRSANPTPDQLVADRETAAGIRQCLSQLVEPRQLAVTLYLLGDKVPEIAERMNWNRRRASNLVYRGLQNMRDCLLEKGLTP